jgi:hypothetical protein
VGEENDAANIPAHQVLSGHQHERRESQVFVFVVMSELLPYKANKADLKMKANFQNKDAIGATHDKKYIYFILSIICNCFIRNKNTKSMQLKLEKITGT